MSQAIAIEIHSVKKLDLKGGILIDGFPSGGLSNSITSMCFMSSVQNQLVSVLESPSFPPISTVRSGIANSPVRIYANEKLRISFLISELNLNHSLYYDVSRTILCWAKENECELVISSGSLSTQETTKEMKHTRKERQPHNLYGAASTESAKQRIIDSNITALELYNGSVTGIPALLLNEGARTDFDVIVLLGKLPIKSSEYRAAAAVWQAIMKLVPGLTCDTKFLISMARTYEQELLRLRANQGGYSIDPYR
ncbi:MAG: PAC2 family protein [Nitrososphaeraceae archaeon]